MASRAVATSFALALTGRSLAAFTAAPSAATTPVPASSAFVQLFEWSWADVALECEQWLGPKGFTAVQLSPATDHVKGDQWWTRYQPVTYNLTSRGGDDAAFADMVQRCNKVGVGIYADAVLNHVADGSGTSIMGNPYGVRQTPIFSRQDLHHNTGDLTTNCRVENYQNKNNVQSCDLQGLPDLCTGCEKVQVTLAAHLDHLADLGVAGIRLDAAKHQDRDELGALLARTKGGMYVMSEVIAGGMDDAVTPPMYFLYGSVTEMNYARTLSPNFNALGKFMYLETFGESWGLMPSSSAMAFIDNHDSQRYEPLMTYKNGTIYALANIFMLAHPYGYPKLMSSYAFTDIDQGPPSTPVHSNAGSMACISGPGKSDAPWICEHRWPAIANMVAWRRSAGTNGLTNFQKPAGDTIAFCRGQAACVALNRQDTATWNATVKFNLPAGKYCNIIVSDDVESCPTIQVAADGTVKFLVPPLSAVAAHVGKKVVPTTTTTTNATAAKKNEVSKGAPRNSAGAIVLLANVALASLTTIFV